MFKISCIIFLTVVVPCLTLFSQAEEVLLTIGGHGISADEFMQIYHKNSTYGTGNKPGVDEYLNLFINFKLKVIEAENLGLDTSIAFHTELDGYVQQLAKPYLSDQTSFEFLLREAYDRMRTEVHASHIMIMANEKASPEDTLIAYRRILELRNRILAGEDFSVVAQAHSEDPSAKTNGGDLGWFGAFRMVYPFESAAYNTSAGQISPPVRTTFGYHIIKVHETRPAKPALHVAHIFVRAPESLTPEEARSARDKIFLIYERLNKGESFSATAKTDSEDKSTGINGGELPWFSSGEMIPEFENTAYALKDTGLYSKPVQSFYGWHIIKLLGKKEVRSFEEEKPDLIQIFNSSDRLYLKQQRYISMLKNEYHFSLSQPALEQFYTFADTNIFRGKWDHSHAIKSNDVLFTIGDKKILNSDFAKFLYQKQRATEPYDLKVFINNQLNSFCESEILGYETEMLKKKNPEFARIVQEYHDGILLFELTDRMVWSKAIRDTAGLEKYYRQHKRKYTWTQRAEAVILTSKEKETTEKARVLTLENGRKKWFTDDYLKKNLCPDDTAGSCFTYTGRKFEKGENPEVDSTEWQEKTIREFEKSGETGFVYIKRLIPPGTKKLDEARGLVTADYQVYLEEEWIKVLKAKYPVVINDVILNKLKQSNG
jgi:peptidyl-prolyl cis-trans isomerase SurA